jgi:hypothetical protein
MIRWFDGPMGQMNRPPSVWCSKYFFFHHFISFLYFYKKNRKINWKGFYEIKNDTWNIRCFVVEMFVPLAQRPSVLTDFNRLWLLWAKRTQCLAWCCLFFSNFWNFIVHIVQLEGAFNRLFSSICLFILCIK